MRKNSGVLRDLYRQTLASATNEAAMQRFLEVHTELIPLEWLLGHGIHFEMVISKLRVNTDFISDFAYLTKNSAVWYVVLLELEDPNKPIFTSDRKRVVFHSSFNAALGQIESWQTQLKRDDAEIKRKLQPLTEILSYNPIRFKFILVYGRDSEYQNNRTRKDRFHDKSSSDIKIRNVRQS